VAVPSYRPPSRGPRRAAAKAHRRGPLPSATGSVAHGRCRPPGGVAGRSRGAHRMPIPSSAIRCARG